MDYYDLGNGSRPVSTSSQEAQTWFDRGLAWAYGFNHEEAAYCFEQAIGCDPDCAMAYWGLGYALGPNYNKPWETFDDADLEGTVARGTAVLARASDLGVAATPPERALITVLRRRYPGDRDPGECADWNAGYAEAMAEVYGKFPGDLDIAALYADALMNIAPWQLWDLRTGAPAENAQTALAKEVLEQALGGWCFSRVAVGHVR